MKKEFVIHWFRQDLRLSDNPALTEAAQRGTVLPVYIIDDVNPGKHALGSASRWWLHHSLKDLDKALKGTLSVYSGNPEEILLKIIKNNNVIAIFWNRCYEPWRIARDKQIKKVLQENNIDVHSYNGSLLWEPWETLKDDNTPYKVFTPYYRRGCVKAAPPRKPLSKPKNIKLQKDKKNKNLIDDLGLLPSIPWDKQLEPHWNIGEKAAQKRLEQFVEQGLDNYKDGRNFPAKEHVSRLSPYLHFGEISPNQVWYFAKNNGQGNDLDHFLSELGWREFSHSLLYHFPKLPSKNLQPKFDKFPWQKNKKSLECWQKGQTGYPIVDAGMRELWQTGYIHNRVRMIVGSFLVKNLLLHWHHGERWFWDCLVDADLANNSASWQWIAGCGADAAPYFRVFNPILQGKKFDAAGEYTRHYVPELNAIPDKYLFSPWEAPEEVLKEAGIILGKTYPEPIVDAKHSRERALDAFSTLKKSQ